MTGDPVVDEYVARLDAALTLPRRMRVNVLTEAEDHLLCAAAELACDGRSATDAAREAVARYGSPGVVAQSHARARASRAAVRLATGVSGSVGCFAVLFAVTTQIPAVHAGIPATAVTSGAAGVVGWIAVQLALVCGALTIIRCRRVRHGSQSRSGDLRLVTRTAATAVTATAISLAFDVAAFIRMPAGQGQHAALVFGLVLASMAATAAALAQVLLAERRLAALERHGREPATADAFDDLRVATLTILGVCAAVPVAGRAASAARPLAAAAFAPTAPLATALRSHPWRSGAGCALLVGLLAGAVHLAAEGPPTTGAWVAALVVLIIGAIEGAAVFCCYLLFGRFLGICATGRETAQSTRSGR